MSTKWKIRFSILLLVVLSFNFLFGSCGKDDIVGSGSINVSNIEGTYVGEFIRLSNGQRGTAYVGNITIKKTTSGAYTLDAICDEYELSQRIEGVQITNEDDRLGIKRNLLDQDKWATLIDFWNVQGLLYNNKLRVIFVHEVNDIVVEHYDFLNGTKKN